MKILPGLNAKTDGLMYVLEKFSDAHILAPEYASQRLSYVSLV